MPSLWFEFLASEPVELDFTKCLASSWMYFAFQLLEKQVFALLISNQRWLTRGTWTLRKSLLAGNSLITVLEATLLRSSIATRRRTCIEREYSRSEMYFLIDQAVSLILYCRTVMKCRYVVLSSCLTSLQNNHLSRRREFAHFLLISSRINSDKCFHQDGSIRTMENTSSLMFLMLVFSSLFRVFNDVTLKIARVNSRPIQFQQPLYHWVLSLIQWSSFVTSRAIQQLVSWRDLGRHERCQTLIRF